MTTQPSQSNSVEWSARPADPMEEVRAFTISRWDRDAIRTAASVIRDMAEGDEDPSSVYELARDLDDIVAAWDRVGFR